ncbi:Profilin/allergen [Atractiella rhizophila]|nr:Profilin/allergen [Atractiella rhizophila]
MSWQVYVDSNLVGTGKIAKAAILGLQGGVWATSSGYTISPQEQKDIAASFADADKALASGIRLGGQKFFTLQATPRSIYGKKGADGVVCVKTSQAIIIGEYIAPIQAGEATTIVEGLADYLISVGY